MSSQAEEPVATSIAATEGDRSRMRTLALLALLIAGVVVYRNSLDGQFMLDDIDHIPRNQAIQQLWPPDYLKLHRPLVNASLALNVAMTGNDVQGFHLFNIAVHLTAGCLLFLLAERLLRQKACSQAVRDYALPLALAIALVWIVHPLNTQAVTYLIQRAEAMMAVCYLLLLYACVRAADAEKPIAWLLIAGAAFVIGLGCKVIIITAPAVVLVMDRVLLQGRLWRRVRQAWWVPVASAVVAAAVLIFSFKIMMVLFNNRSVGFKTEFITPLGYLMTQPRVLALYLGLSVWPDGLCLDHAFPAARSFADVWWAWAGLIALLGWCLWGYVRKKAIVFPAFAGLLILTPTSSFIPLRDLAAEHRMYMPLMAVIALTVMSVFGLIVRMMPSIAARRALLLVALLATIIPLGWRTIHRNADYHDEVAMWGQIATQKPHNMRAHVTYGFMLIDSDPQRAEAHLLLAAKHSRGALAGIARINLAKALIANNKPREALAQLDEAAKTLEKTRISLYRGEALMVLGQPRAAIPHFTKTVHREPDNVDYLLRLGLAMLDAGQPGDAVEPLRHAAALQPHQPMLHSVLGLAYARSGNMSAATAAFDAAFAIDANHLQTHVHVAESLITRRRYDEAAKRLAFVIQRSPTFAEAHYQAGRLWEARGERASAIASYREAIAQDPHFHKAKQAIKRLLPSPIE